MKITDEAQHGENWHTWRAAGIGSSDASAIMGVSKWTTADKIMRQKKSGVTRKDTVVQARGKRLEPVARELYHRIRGIITRPVLVTHDVYPWLRASLDGLSLDNTRILEIKCVRKELHMEALAGRIPEEYYPQLQHQLMVTGLKDLDYWSYSESSVFAPVDRVALVEVHPDEEYMKQLFEREMEFQNRLKAGTE